MHAKLGYVISTLVAIALLACPAGAFAVEEAKDILIADFEGQTYGDWKVEGDAFGAGPAKGTLQGQMTVRGYLGKALVNTYLGGDGATGTLTSPPLKIERKHINFLIGGGKHPGQTCINLLIGGKCVRTATGYNNSPGGSEALAWQSWDVTDLAGKMATIQIVDKRKGGWGHVNVDQIMQSDKKRQSAAPATPPPAVAASREITIDKRYLHLPVKNGAPGCRVKLVVDGETAREFTIELAEGEPDFWVFADMADFAGKKIRVEVDKMTEGAKGLEAITQADEVPGAAGMYKEKHRQQFHFSSRRGWNNDSNGLVYYKGEYHLYYQHNPYGWKWGNMHWGHAVSDDLVHWKELPIAIYPHRFGDWVFSGSAVVDADNTAGFKTGDEDVIVAAYTSTGRGEAIAYSNDRGRTFADYAGNPVVKHSGRDPKVIWYAPGKHWVMALFDQVGKSRGIALYTSTNLKDWQRTSRIDGYYECPEIFEIALDGKADTTKWVVYGADGKYAVGSFDGKTFAPDGDRQTFHYGNCFYASQTFSNIPADDGRRIQIAWGRIDTPGMPFNQCMLFPVELTLRTTSDGPRMFTMPVREIEKLRGKKHEWKDCSLTFSGRNPLAAIDAELMDISAEIDISASQEKEVGFFVRGTPVSYDVAKQTLTCKGKTAPLKCPGGKLSLRILVDRTSIEIYANDGEVYMPIGVIHPEENRSLEPMNIAKATRLTVWELRSAWE